MAGTVVAPPQPADVGDDTELGETARDAVHVWLWSPVVDDWLATRSGPLPDRAVFEAVQALRDHDPGLARLGIEVIASAAGQAFVLDGRWPGPVPEAIQGAMEAVDSEPGTSSFIGRRVTLRQHLDDVGEWVGAMAAKCGLAGPLIDDLVLAGRLHDLGKADPRFQQILADGRAPDVLLAKSDRKRTTAAARRQAQRRSGYPERARHELLSTSLAEHAGSLRQEANDWDLVLHLVASHHGHARPTVPVALDDRPVAVAVPASLLGVEITGSSDHRMYALDAGVAERYWALTARYGWFGLAWMEALLRLADHRASAERQNEGAAHA